MATTAEIKQRTAFESERRARLAVPAVAGGVLYLLSGIILSATLKELPAVGVVQGLEPVLRGEPNPAISPRAAEVKYIDHHALGLIAGSLLTAVSVAALTLVLLFLLDANRFRGKVWPVARPLVLIGGIGVGLLNVIHEVILVVEAHKFTTGGDFTNKAVDRALLTTGSGGILLGILGLVAALALAVGMIAVMMGAMRVGLLPRWLGVLGILSGLLFLPFFGTTTLQLIPTFWLVATGILLMERYPNGDPPAWAAGEARPWPSQADLRAKREQESGGAAAGKDTKGRGPKESSKSSPNGDEPAADLAPAPTPAATGSRRKRRKRG
ncbi:MAG TPA: hypothetical protein VK781_10140 [Solirubrobacteraceae bacterium]|jgi:hypothetical protein|nr:hypothetical protein [Solirubrobacteraceae bacterium]